MVSIRRALSPSIRQIVPASSLATQTVLPLPVTASALGPAPTPIVQRTLFEDGSTRETVPSSELATQTAPGPTATALAPWPTLTGGVTIPALGSIRVSVPADL